MPQDFQTINVKTMTGTSLLTHAAENFVGLLPIDKRKAMHLFHISVFFNNAGLVHFIF
jgi:hypothetical protein